MKALIDVLLLIFIIFTWIGAWDSDRKEFTAWILLIDLLAFLMLILYNLPAGAWK